MRLITTTLGLSLLASQACQAAQQQSCDALKYAIQQRGELVIHYASPSGLLLFDRFVSNPDRCLSKLTLRVSIPTSSPGKCVLMVCDQSNDLRP